MRYPLAYYDMRRMSGLGVKLDVNTVARDDLTDEVALPSGRRIFGIETCHEVKNLVGETIGRIAIGHGELKLVFFTAQNESARLTARGDSEDTAIGKKTAHRSI